MSKEPRFERMKEIRGFLFAYLEECGTFEGDIAIHSDENFIDGHNYHLHISDAEEEMSFQFHYNLRPLKNEKGEYLAPSKPTHIRGSKGQESKIGFRTGMDKP